MLGTGDAGAERRRPLAMRRLLKLGMGFLELERDATAVLGAMMVRIAREVGARGQRRKIQGIKGRQVVVVAVTVLGLHASSVCALASRGVLTRGANGASPDNREG